MKKHYLIIALLLSLGIKAQIVNIPDTAFKTKLMASGPTVNIAKNQAGQKIKIDADNDGNIQESEAALVYWLNVSNANIADMTGITSFINLKTLTCYNNDLTSLDVSMLPMQELKVSNNNLTSLNVAGITNLHILDCGNNELSTLNLTGCNNLIELYCINNGINSLNVAGFGQLTLLNCNQNNLTSLDLSGLVSLETINCSENQITSLNFSGLNSLETADCSINSLISFTPGNNTAHTLTLNNNNLTSLDVTTMPGLQYLYCNSNQLTAINVAGMSQLKQLECRTNNLSSLSLSGLSLLEWLMCNNNNLTTLDFSDCPGILQFNCSFNDFVTLDVSSLTLLEALYCESNQLTTLNVTGLEFLSEMTCSNNQLSHVDLTGTIVNEYNCSHNLFTELDFSDRSIEYLTCSNNPLTSLKLGHVDSLICEATSISTLTFPYPCFYFVLNNSLNLVSLFIKNNGVDGQDAIMFNVPNLTYICADDADLPGMGQFWLMNAGEFDDVEINNYCSYTPGDFYDINVTQKYDIAADGCGAGDNAVPNMHFDITNGTISGTITSNASGSYRIPVQEGTHTITPVFENPYFTASPASATIIIPGPALPIMQNFCITSNGAHPDVEIALFNINTGVPGFDSNYRIVYKNMGTTTATGIINLSFDDTVLDFITANPVTDNQSTGTLSWNYSNLQPFETRIIDFTLNLNSPVEIPPLNQDDVLEFSANISLTADETPLNNTATLSQTVFNAVDPNDKTCLEGNTITPEMVGEYVHYKIRFENTGNYPAAIVTVKDVIDTSKFDISTLTPITASHPFITRITNTNQVEFVFDNIMLPFDDANNDGYVIFKIKTKPTLVLGDELSNTANIYFNYNPPVTTNTAITTVAIPLSTEENENTFGFALYPNPVKNVLNISSKVNTEINSIEIYNMLGQEILKALPAAGQRSIDMSSLSGGQYIIRIISGKTSWNAKFIKE